MRTKKLITIFIILMAPLLWYLYHNNVAFRFSYEIIKRKCTQTPTVDSDTYSFETIGFLLPTGVGTDLVRVAHPLFKDGVLNYIQYDKNEEFPLKRTGNGVLKDSSYEEVKDGHHQINIHVDFSHGKIMKGTFYSDVSVLVVYYGIPEHYSFFEDTINSTIIKYQ